MTVQMQTEDKNLHGTQWVNIDGIEIEYRFFTKVQQQDNTQHSDTQKPVIIMLHEGLGCVELWKQFPQQLADTTGLSVLAYSRQGYGRSSPITLPRPLDYMHQEAQSALPALLDVLNLQDVILFGHSDGASIAIIHAGIEGKTIGRGKQQRLQGLVLMAPHVFNEERCVNSIRQAKVAYENTNLRQQLQKYHHDNVDGAFWGWNGAWLDPGFLTWNIEAYLSDIKVPLLLIQGRDDEYGTIKQLSAIEEQVKSDTRLCLLNDCKHSPHRDRPDAVLIATQEFIHDCASAKTHHTHTGG